MTIRPVPRVPAAAQDAVFRFYLPLARSLAADAAVREVDSVVVGQAAELGFARAVLGWRGSNARGLERFARSMITVILRQVTAAPVGMAAASVSSTAPPTSDHRTAEGDTSPGSGS